MELQDIEIGLLLEGVRQHYGYDFRQYAPVSLKRRVLRFLDAEGLESVSAAQDRVLHDPMAMQRLLQMLSVSTSSMYRDPGFFRSFRSHVVPVLRTYPFLRIWHAGCAQGEEVRSMAILLQEEDLYLRSRIYATDMNEELLARACAGIYPIARVQGYTRNYVDAGGTRPFSDYYTAAYGHAVFRPALLENVVWAQHNLVTDGVFNTFQVILCRNVMIYFDSELRARVHKLIYDSLETFGILALGSRESLLLTPFETCYEVLDGQARLYRKVR